MPAHVVAVGELWSRQKRSAGQRHGYLTLVEPTELLRHHRERSEIGDQVMDREDQDMLAGSAPKEHGTQERPCFKVKRAAGRPHEAACELLPEDPLRRLNNEVGLEDFLYTPYRLPLRRMESGA